MTNMAAVEGRVYFGFAISDQMFMEFTDKLVVAREVLPHEEAREILQNPDVVKCLNPNYRSSIDAMNDRFDIHVEIPKDPAKVSLDRGDQLIIMQVSGLPREKKIFSHEEIASADFHFARWTVLGTIAEFNMKLWDQVDPSADPTGDGMYNMSKNASRFFGEEGE